MAPPVPTPVDLTGRRFGRLTVVELSPERTRLRRAKWMCRCDCGEVRLVRGDGLRRGITVSCGCHARDLLVQRITRHGRARTSEYAVWAQMRYRCRNPRSADYPDYGGRGITVCPEWDSFERFLADMGPCPPGHSLDRIDNGRGYSPENCRWATMTTQRGNTRRALVYPNLTAHGETLTLSAWADRLGCSPEAILERLKGGWPAEKAVTTPVKRYRTRASQATPLSRVPAV